MLLPLSATAPMVGWVRFVTVSGSPSESLSFAKAATVTGVASMESLVLSLAL